MKKITILLLSLFICSTYTACNDVKIEGEISCDDGAIKCQNNTSYVICVNGKWDESNPKPCAAQQTCNSQSIDKCFTDDNPPTEQNKSCEKGSIKCLDGGYSICNSDGEWPSKLDCPSGKTCTDIENCLKTIEIPEDPDQCTNGMIKCDTSNSNQYITCEGNQWGTPKECPYNNSCDDGIEKCFEAPDIPIEDNICETGAIKCDTNRTNYVICDNNQWINSTPCPNDNICDDGIEKCFKTSEILPETNSVIKCDSSNSNQYFICKDDICSEPYQCPNSLGCHDDNLDDCFEPVDIPVHICDDGTLRCAPGESAKYQICSNNEWGESQECPNGNDCSPNIMDCFKTIDDISELQCSDDSTQVKMKVNDSWTVFDDCDSKNMTCSQDYGTVCFPKDVCDYIPVPYINSVNGVLHCNNNQYKAESSNPAFICFYNAMENKCEVLNSLPTDGSFSNSKTIKDNFTSYDEGHCYQGNTTSYAFRDGSTLCRHRDSSDHYSIYLCRKDGWLEIESYCDYCIQYIQLLDPHWQPDDDWNIRTEYKLEAKCINNTNITYQCSQDGSYIQLSDPNDTTSNIAYCSSFGRTCETDTDGQPKCK